MNELRKRMEDYFSGPGFWPFVIMMAVLLLPSIMIAVVYL